MHICIPIEHRSEGGLYTFLAYWREYLAGREIPTTTDLAEARDVLFVNSFVVPYETVREAKRRTPALRVVQRVDGSAVDYGRIADDDARQACVNLLADLTVYQSAYGRYATRHKHRVMTHDGPVIHNPVDGRRFSPDGERVPLPGDVRVAYVTYSLNPRKGADAVYRAARDNPDLTFILGGRYEAPPALPNVHLLGLISRERLPAVLRSCHALAFFSENETCSNVVLEAMASGLPVFYLDSGGTRELVGDTGISATPEDFGSRFRASRGALPELGRAARRRAVEHFSPEVVFGRYVDAIEHCHPHRPPGTGAYVRARMRGYPVLPIARRRIPLWCLERLWARVATRAK